MRLQSIPDRVELGELLRPWKLATFAIAMALLIYGALNFHIGDWDLGVTLIMGTLTYVFAAPGVRALATAVRRPSGPALLDGVVALAIAWFVIDGAYLAWHTLKGNPIYRADNFHASTPIYFMAGLFWLYRGSLSQMIDNLRSMRMQSRH